MIGRLHGSLTDIDIETGMVLLDVSGVGYEVEVASSVLGAAPQTGEPLTLHTHMVVREDAQLLFGFSTRAERNLFRGFIRINGVGPKMALALISTVEPASLARAVRNNDISVLTRVPGVGKKTAERLMVELKSRIDDLAGAAVPAQVVSVTGGADAAPLEAEDALVALGYRPHDASRAVGVVMRDATEDLGAEEIIRRALRTFAQAGSGA